MAPFAFCCTFIPNSCRKSHWLSLEGARKNQRPLPDRPPSPRGQPRGGYHIPIHLPACQGDEELQFFYSLEPSWKSQAQAKPVLVKVC